MSTRSVRAAAARRSPARVRAEREPWARIAAALLVVGSVVVLPGALDRYVLAKPAVVAAGICCAFVAAPARGRLPRAVVVTVVAGAGWLLACSALAADPWTALLGRAPRYEGAFVLATYALALGAGARILGPGSSAVVRRTALVALEICVGAVVALALLEAAGLRPLSTSVDRPGSLLGNATDQGAWCLVAGAVLLAVAVHRRDRVAGLLAAAAAAGVVLSGSRAALLGVVVAVVLGAVLLRRDLRRDRRALGLVAVGLVGVAVLAAVVPATRDRVSGANAGAVASVEGRTLLWSESVALVSRRPVVGVGPSQFVDAITSEHTRDWYVRTGTALPPDSPHDFVLQAAAAGGIVLVLLLLALLASVTIGAVRRLRASSGGTDLMAVAALSAGAGLVVVLTTHPTTPGPLLLTLALVGAGCAAAPPPATSRDRLLAMGGSVAAGLCVVVLFLAALAEIPLRVGVEDTATGDAAAASDAFSLAAALRPWDPEVPAAASYALAMAAESGGQAALAQDALRFADRARTNLTSSVELATARAAALDALGRHDQALRALDAALVGAPGHPGLLNRRGVVEAELGDLAAAERDLRAALAAAPGDPSVQQNLARVLALRQRA